MVGRRFTISSSEDEAERLSRRTSCLTEEEVLQPVSKDLQPDNWPCFVLNGAVVYGKDGKTPANLLHAELEGPLIVRGKLEVDKEFRHLRKIRMRKTQEVEVTDVKGFSIGLGPITIWADGKAGWFEIRPASTYQHIFDKMSEGVTLYYFLIDLYENKKRTAGEKTLQIDKIFEEYLKKFDESMTHAQVAERCEEHAVFLLSQMRKSGEPVRWTHTTFYRWLVEKCRHIYDRYRAKNEYTEVSERTAHTIAGQASGSKKKKIATASGTHLPNRTKNRNSSSAVILKLMADLHTSDRIRRTRLNLLRLSRAIYDDFDVEGEDTARVIVEAHAEPIFLGLDAKWSQSPIYRELEQILSKPERKTSMRESAKEIILTPRTLEESNRCHVPAQDLNGNLARRRKRSLQSEEDEDSTLPEDEPESRLGSQQQRIGRKAKRRQSFADEILPRNSRIDKGKAPASPSEASHTMTTRSRSSSDEELILRVPVSILGRRRGPSRSGKVATLRLVGSSPAMRRLSPSLSDDETGEGPSNKRPRMSHLTMTDDSELTQSSNDLTPYFEGEGLGEDEEEIDAMEGLTLASEPILSSSPQGPNGLWSCQREGCDYKVGAADKPDGRAMVRTHFLQHADEIAEREALVLKESKPYLPTNHLLEMLRSLGESARLAEERKIGTRVVPQPIKRRLAV